MLFTESAFLLFCPLVLLVYWLTRSDRLRKVVLLIASYVFYGFWDYRFCLLLMLSTMVDFFVGRALAVADERKGRRLLTLSLVYNFALLGFFKYFNFFADSLRSLAASGGIKLDSVTLDVVLPVGISFFTFQSLSYTLDVYRKQLKPARSLLDFATFIAFFPQLVAGPIVRASDFLKQLPGHKGAGDVDLLWSLGLFLIGFFKKACVADNLAPFADAFFTTPTAFGTCDAWLGALAYAGQIYCDFSGYTDMAIAVAGLFGYTLRSNFAAPYLASSITDFWRRWHTSLSTWLRDYLYISLGGGRHGVRITYRNLMVTMLLGGLWHGASWNFVIWGGMHGLALVIHKEWTRLLPKRMFWQLGWFFTMLWVVLAWVPFRASSLGVTLGALRALFGGGNSSATLSTDGGLGFGLLLGFLFAGHALFQARPEPGLARRLSWWQWGLAYGVCWALVLGTRRIGYVPFVYFQF